MSLKSIFKVSRKTFFNPAGWIGYEGLKDQNRVFISVLRSMFQKPTPELSETFTEAKKRLGLSQRDIKAITSRYQLYAFVFSAMTLVVFIYAFYLIIKIHSISGFILGIVCAGLFLSQAFRYDFWTMQLRKQKLGLKFKDWINFRFCARGKIND